MEKECGNKVKENEIIDTEKKINKDVIDKPVTGNEIVKDNNIINDTNKDKRPKKGLIISIILIILILLGIGGYIYFYKSNDNKEQANWLTAGTYQVGKDIKTGEYLFVATKDDAKYSVSSDKSDNKTSVVANDTVTNQAYLTVSKGQYLTVKGGKICEIKNASVYTDKDGKYKDGEYKVGRDLKAGKYKLHSDALGYYVILSSSDGSISSIVKNENFNGDKTINLKDGQYIKITDAYMVMI